MTNRRNILKSAVGGIIALSSPPFISSALAAEQLALTPLTGNLTMLSGVGGNVVAFSPNANSGLVLVDSGAPSDSAALMSQLSELSNSGVKTLFNTHYHLDQTGSNAALGRDGAKIIAHQNTKLWLSTDYYVPTEDRYEKARLQEAIPTETFYTSGKMSVAEEQISYGYLLEAHTAGDIYVHFEDSNVLAAGDVVSPVKDPVLDYFAGGWIGGRVDAMDLLLALSNDDTQIIPAYGPVLTRAHLQAERDMMAYFYERMAELVREGLSAQQILDGGIMDGIPRTFDDPFKFLYDAHKGLWAHHNNLSHNVV